MFGFVWYRIGEVKGEKVKVEEVDGGCGVEGGSINTSGRKNNMTMTTKKCPVFSSVSAGTDATSRAGIELRSRQKRSRSSRQNFDHNNATFNNQHQTNTSTPDGLIGLLRSDGVMAFSKESILILFLVHCLRCCGGFVGSGSGSGDGRCRWSRRRRCPTLAVPLVKPDQKLRMGDNLMSKSHAKSILIVENDDNLRKAIGKFLAKGGYHVTGVSDARSAMLVCRGIVRPVNSSRTRLKLDPNLLRQHPESDIGNNSTTSIIPDCLVLDIQDGLGLLKVIRSDPLLTSLPVVLLTAKGKVEDRIIGYESDADAYLPKPFEPDELQSIIDGLLRRDKKLSTSRDARGGTTEGFGNTKTNTVYGELKRELMEIKALLNLNAPTDGMSVVTGDSLERDISEIKDRLKGLADQTPQDAKPMKDQYDTLSILSPGELLHALMFSLLCY